MEKDYQHMDQPDIERLFREILSALDMPSIDYVAIALVNRLSRKSIALMSNHEWAQAYYKGDRPQHDPVRNLALTTSSSTIIFDKIPLSTDREAAVMDLRHECGIQQGFMLIKRNGLLSTHLTIGSEKKSFNATENLLASYADYQILLDKLQKVIEMRAKMLRPELFL
jgi:hypothetical protein